MDADGPTAPTGDPIGMTPEERREHAALLMTHQLRRTLPADHPHVVLTGGQPGSGKSYIVDSMGVHFAGRGNVVVVDPDEIRPTLPYMAERIARGDLEIPDAANVDAGTIAYEMVQIAKAERRNVLVDGTLQNTDRALSLAEEMRRADYVVDFHGMAVHPGLSHARTYGRLEEQIAASPTGFGRGVGDAFHAQAVKGYALTVEAFQKKSAVATMTLHYDDTGRTVTSELVRGKWMPETSMKAEIDRVHARPTADEARSTTRAWAEAVKRMAERNADPTETERVQGLRSFAAEASAGPWRHDAPAGGHPHPVDAAHPSARAVTALVRASLEAAGRDAGKASMTVNWAKDEAILEIRAHDGRGPVRHELPGHARVENRLALMGPLGVLDADLAETPRVDDGPSKAALSAYAAQLGVDPADMGLRLDAPSPTVGIAARTTMASRAADGMGR